MKENDRVMSKASHVVEIGEARLREKESELQTQIAAAREAEASACKKEAEAEKLVVRREWLISTAASIRTSGIREECTNEYNQRLAASYQRDWDVVRSHLTWIIVIAAIYSLVITAAVIIQWIF